MYTKDSELISDLALSVFFSRKSFFRYYQEKVLLRFGKHFSGVVIEVGGEVEYETSRFFPNATKFICSNIGRNHDYYLDITKTGFESNSQDGYVCVSVLEHVYDFQEAILEMERTLRPGGKLLITVPFAYSHHDVVDYWRFGRDAYDVMLKNFRIISFIHCGGMFSSIVDNLRRPRRSWRGRYLLYKVAAIWLLFIGKIFDRKDGFPLGFAVYAEKN